MSASNEIWSNYLTVISEELKKQTESEEKKYITEYQSIVEEIKKDDSLQELFLYLLFRILEALSDIISDYLKEDTRETIANIEKAKKKGMEIFLFFLIVSKHQLCFSSSSRQILLAIEY